MSVNDRWVRPASKYWMYRSHASDMDPVSLVVSHRQELGLRPLLHWLARERNWVRTCGSVSRRAVDYVESPFSQEQWDLSKSVGVSWRVAIWRPCEIRMILDHTRTEHGKRVTCWLSFPLYGVHRFESPQLSDSGGAPSVVQYGRRHTCDQ
jgi:hypothetical protein